ncbi:3-ketoacyl-ACP reductase [Paenibacillus sp. 79R4]|uniref:SDR family NAD(P)-dependent oxidoreductase n=1 Tax=Paenibacillus sp. 79R4 TaxID=2212847 RepID=UPI0015B7A5EE|nr:3-ketoacyl-ACP reductase [Paenibacillus sp. 79R4]
MSLQGRVVIVTGAGQGIGRGVAKAYAELGASVVAAEMNETAGSKVIEEINSSGGTGLFVPCDVRQEADIIRLMAAAHERFGRIDVLINNAGVSRFKDLFDLTVEDWDDVLNTNVRSCFLASREAAKYMKAGGRGGAIVNISSTRYLMSEPNSEAYAASKGAIASLSHALAVTLGSNQIRVNCISPGWIETGDYGALRDIDHQQHPAGRVGTPEDIARACLYLTDPNNTFVTGAHIVVDGGMTRKMIYEP